MKTTDMPVIVEKSNSSSADFVTFRYLRRESCVPGWEYFIDERLIKNLDGNIEK
jgi:hypothetical protein